jgi:hypothetical protein
MTESKDKEVVALFDADTQLAESVVKDAKDIRKSIQITLDTFGMTVYAVASHTDPERNLLLEIPIPGGDPLTYEAHTVVKDIHHNIVRDAIEVRGVSYHEIGHVPVNYRISIDGVLWETDVPLPAAVIKRYMTDSQKQSFEAWKSRFKGRDHEIHYIQTVDIY